MKEEIPEYVNLIFTLTTLYGVWLFKRAFKPSINIFSILFVWLSVQGYLAYSGFYQDTESMPPKFALAIIPGMVFIAYLFLSKKGKAFIYELDLETLHWIHTIRVPVEIVLWLLYIASQIPEIMTFEGRNYDIIAGLTAPLIVFYGLRKPILDKNRMILWNLLSLFLLINIVVMAILSVESPFQQLSFEQPNKGILLFPYVWLASFIVPMVLFSHLASIKLLLKK